MDDEGGVKEEGQQSLTERYKLASENEDSKNWACLLDFESPVQLESDWYSTQTFQVFLDALDINQPTSLGRDSSISNLNSATASSSAATVAATSTTVAGSRGPDNDKNGIPSRVEPKAQQKGSNSNFETILSAEALKILSELPDLSHMSMTRSFIFPNAKNNSSTTTAAGKR